MYMNLSTFLAVEHYFLINHFLVIKCVYEVGIQLKHNSFANRLLFRITFPYIYWNIVRCNSCQK